MVGDCTVAPLTLSRGVRHSQMIGKIWPSSIREDGRSGARTSTPTCSEGTEISIVTGGTGLVRMFVRRSGIGRRGGLHFPMMFLGFGRRGRGVAGRIAVRIGSGVGRCRIRFNLSTVIAGFALGSGGGVSGRLLGFLCEQGGSCQKCNKKECFHKILHW
jgi:hypothetical protein